MLTSRNKFDRREQRVRQKIKKVSKNLPRLTVFKSNAHLHVQIIDDSKGQTLVSVSTQQKDFIKLKNKKNCDAAVVVGSTVAEKAKKSGVTKVVFDKGGYKFHGVIKNLADAARGAGLEL